MIAWLLKRLGFKLYVVRYRFPSKSVPGRMVEGKSSPMLKCEANYIAAWGKAKWSGEHWVEPA